MMGLKTAFIVVACACILLSMFLTPLCSASAEDDARSAITVAKQRITVCYVAVAEADKAGANVSNLLSTLDAAGMNVSRADLAFQNGNFTSAYDLAVQSQGALEGFETQANSIREAAERSSSVDFWVNVVGSSTGAVAVVVGSFALWLLLKKRYGQGVQVVSGEHQRV
jgi:hypothetical protein